MDVNQPLSLLAGLTPAQFMHRHWQKKPLVVRQAIAGLQPLLSRAELFKLAATEAVESRLIVQNQSNWTMKHGPFAARALPALSQNAWTLLLQGVDLHDARAHQLLQQFRFVPDARLDDLMISFATPGGGVGPHFDSYDVFLLQVSGRRRWKISRQKDLSLQSGMPLKILQNFQPEEEFVLEAGDMLYLPPRYAHDGVAEACEANGKPQDCMTYSIGFRAPARRELAAELLHRLAEFHEDDEQEAAQGEGAVPARAPDLYRDPDQPATASPGAMPPELAAFAEKVVHDALKAPLAVACALGEYMTEPKPSVWFEEAVQQWVAQDGGTDLFLVAQTRMMYDAHHVFINGESHRAKGADARLMQSLADQRGLTAKQLGKASGVALSLLSEWHEAGWLQSAAAK
jgi:50S ribosomal protein L16 3-hydroxylase